MLKISKTYYPPIKYKLGEAYPYKNFKIIPMSRNEFKIIKPLGDFLTITKSLSYARLLIDKQIQSC